ncbi:MAG: hypothetical protein M3Q77_00330 [Thermoproteota archaeon]|nr:hypothetical protein [Thermoproteota archaeon]
MVKELLCQIPILFQQLDEWTADMLERIEERFQTSIIRKNQSVRKSLNVIE